MCGVGVRRLILKAEIGSSSPGQSLSFSDIDVGAAFQFINDISQRRTNRSEWCRGNTLAFKSIGRAFAPRPRFVLFRHRRRVSIYKSYCREETKYNRSEWRRGKALEFKSRDQWFDCRQRFLFFTRRLRRRVQFIILQMKDLASFKL